MLLKLPEGKETRYAERNEARVEATLSRATDELRNFFSAVQRDSLPQEIDGEVYSTGRDATQLGGEMRRDLIVRSNVLRSAQSPLMLLHTSIAGEVQSISDYARNLFDLASAGALSTGAADDEPLRSFSATLPSYLEESEVAFRYREADRSRYLLAQGQVLLGELDEALAALVHGHEQQEHAVARALAYWYLKRIVTHLLNLLTAVAIPPDHLDHPEGPTSARW